jgi:SAM-dependent methyltransferase
MNVYDRIPYVNRPHAQTHPDRLSVLAQLHGLHPGPIETARVLDLGASEGGNIIPMAMCLPKAQFTGIELAAVPVERGNRVIQDLGLTNIRLLQMDLMDVDAAFGEFDYIIAHGLYAWTPPPVRDKLLAIAHANLSPHGVAFVSYNAHPFGHVRRMLRELMLFRIGDAMDLEIRLERARHMLGMLASREAQFKGLEAGIAAAAAEVAKLSDGALCHDYLGEVYEPAYISDFAAHAARHGLAYLADAEVFDERRYQLAAPLLEEVKRLSGTDRVAREQYLDLLRLRKFRQSLVCHAERGVHAEWKLERAVGLYVGTLARETPEGKFEVPGGASATTTHPGILDFLRGLAAMWPRFARITEREAAVTLEMFRAGLVEVRSHPGFAGRAGDRPAASRLARYQAQRGESHVTSFDHHAIELEDQRARDFLLLLDGTRDRTALAEAMGSSPDQVDKRLAKLEEYGLFPA